MNRIKIKLKNLRQKKMHFSYIDFKLFHLIQE